MALFCFPFFQVRLLTGVGRFNEMSYIFDTLFEHEHFELLCRRGIDKVKTESLFEILVSKTH